MPKPLESSPKMRKDPSQRSVHTFREPISCRGVDCGTQFYPKRKDQVFCSPACRLKYFNVARAIGLIFLEKCKADASLKVMVDGLLKILRNPDEAEGMV